MAFITLIVVLISLVLLYKYNNQLVNLTTEIQLLKHHLKQLKDKLDDGFPESKEKASDYSTPIEPIVFSPAPKKEEFVPQKEEQVEPPAPVFSEPIFETVGTAMEEDKQEEDIFVIRKQERNQPRTKTNLEQFIGEKLISLVGIAILVLGIFFVVKWAIDRHLITDAGKVLIGLASGTALVLVAHRLAKNYRAFSSILVGGGIAVYYFSVYEAYQAYHLLSQPLALSSMIVVTIAAIALSLVYDKKELAMIALAGGFLTPFLVSDGSGNYQVLFTYLLILDLGIFALAYFKKWPLVQITCYFLTVIIFGGWVVNAFTTFNGGITTRHGMLFATLFYLVFFGTTLVYAIRKKEKFSTLDIGILLSNTFLYYGAGYFFLSKINQGEQQGIFTMILALFNFVFAYLFYKRKTIDRNLIFLLIGLVLTFVSLTAPIQLQGNYITLFWACEFVLLYWLGGKSGIPLIKQTSVIVWLLCLGSLLLDWQNNYFTVQVYALPIVLNKALIAGAVVCGATVLLHQLVKKQATNELFFGLFTHAQYGNVLQVVTVLLLYSIGFLELQYQTQVHVRFDTVVKLHLFTYHFLFLIGLFLYARKRNLPSPMLPILTGIGMITLLSYLWANSSITVVRMLYLKSVLSFIYFALHGILFISALYVIYLLWNYVRRQLQKEEGLLKLLIIYLCVMGVVVCSAELLQLWVWAGYEEGYSTGALTTKGIKTGWPILWSLISFALMYAGMRYRWKLLRIISLSLFTLTIVKLFAYDISNVGQGGKIAAFISLGLVLLAVSFMYQRIKGLFLDEEK